MKNVLFYLKRLPKRFAMFALLLSAFVTLPLQSALAADVNMEGSIGVRNISVAPASNFETTTNAAYEQVVEFRVFYHNMEQPDSGKTADQFKVKVDIPTASGRNQTVKVTMGGSNTNTIEDTATVVLNRDDAFIEYVAGSARWDHNPGDRNEADRVTTPIADSVILNGEVLEQQVQPCNEYRANIYFQARVRVPSVDIHKTVRKAGTTENMQPSIQAQAGERVEYVVTIKNLGNTDLTNVYVRDPLPDTLAYVAGTGKKFFGTYNGTPMDDIDVLAFFTGQKNIGTLGPGATAFLTFEATVAPATQLACGANVVKNIAVVDTDQTGEYNNSATVNVNKECANVPAYSCDLFRIKQEANRTITVTEFKQSASNGATFKDVVVSWGDNTTSLTTNNPVNQKHQYAKDGAYVITATARFTVNNETKEASGANCVQNISFNVPAQPTVLPNTGAGDIAGVFAAVTAAGTLAHRFVLGRRFES